MLIESPSTDLHRAVPRPTVGVLLALAAVVLVGLVLHLWGIAGDLPYAPDVDEPVFVKAAVGMLQHRTLNPGWFAHPGSTIIYPTAALVEVWYQIAKHVAPFAQPKAGIGGAFAADPTPFYLIGRLISVAYGVGCIVATWLLARRIVGNGGAVLATMLLPATAIVVGYGQLVRTDLAGLFFALIAVWLSVRAMEGDRSRDWVVAAVAIGLAIASRYFYAVLVVPYVVAAWFWLPAGDRGRRWPVPLFALLAAPVAFVIVSPFVVLDLHSALAQIFFEAGDGVHPGADGLSPIGNLLWYVGQVIPATCSPIILVLAIAGLVVALRSNTRATVVVVAFGVAYLVGISASPLHWDRYVIPLVPVIGIFVAAALLAISDRLVRTLGTRWDRVRFSVREKRPSVDAEVQPRILAVAVACAILFLVLLPSLLSVAAADRLRGMPSTRVVATEWVARNLPLDDRIAEEMYTAYLDQSKRDVLRVVALPDRSLGAYRSGGYRYLISSSAMSGRYTDPVRYPKENAFYASLEIDGRLIASFEPGPDRAGPRISIYDLASP
jgi:4-amino-4-deoxy-L-arabinose transferase-like glycosyltransferase